MDTIWQELGLKANPFDEVALTEGGAIDIEEAFVGRDYERKLLTDIVQSHSHSCVAICGEVGVGKTSLANVHKHFWKFDRDDKPLFSFRGEVEARPELLNKNHFILEIIATVLREIHFLAPHLVGEHDVLKKTTRLVDITQDFSWSAGVSAGVGIEAGVGESTVRPPDLPVAKLEGYLTDLLQFIRSHDIGGRLYQGVIVHVNNFDVVMVDAKDKARVKTFFDEIRDFIQWEHVHFLFLGPPNFFDDAIRSRQRVRGVFHAEPLLLKPLNKQELADALSARMQLLQSDNVGAYVNPVSDEVIFALHDLYEGDVRLVLRALSSIVANLGGSFSYPLQSDEALLLLARERSRRLQEMLSPVQREVLQYVVEAELAISQAEVSRKSGKAASNMSMYFKEFRQRGIIEELSERVGKEKKFRLTKHYLPLKHLTLSQEKVRDRLEGQKDQLKLF